MKHEERIFMVILLIVMVVMAVMSLKYGPGARILPLVSGISAAVMMSFLVSMAFFPKIKTWYQALEAKTILSKVTLSDSEKKREIWIVAWFTGCTFLIYVFGFVIGIPLFLLAFLKLWAKESWVLSVTLSLIVLGVVWFSFVYVLSVPLHEGIVFS